MSEINGYDYDIVVLGGGPGGYVAAIRAAQLGARVALIEKSSLGGTCLNVGCMPTKTIFNSAKIVNDIKKECEKGIFVEVPEVNMLNVIANKDKVVRKLVRGISSILKSHQITVYNGKGHVNKNKTIHIVEGDDKNKTLSYKKLIIAAGSITSLPSIPGIHSPGILTSTEALNLREVPKELVIVGGGVIACEFANIFRAFGSKVTIIAKGSRILSSMDEEVSKAVKNSFTELGIQVMTNTTVEKIENNESKYYLNVSGESSEIVETEKVLIAIGRKACFEGIEDLGLDTVDDTIKVDKYLKTNIEDVYAVGDVTNQIKLAHIASAQGIKAAENALGKTNEMRYSIIPNCIYIMPEVGTVGLSEEEARNQYKDIRVGRFPMYANGKALAAGETEGFVKIIIEKKYGEILGVHIVAPNATEIIAEAAMLMKLEGTVEELIDTIHGHPTVSESLVEAAYDALGGAINLPR